MVDAQADRVRRHAEEKGLKREPAAEKPKKPAAKSEAEGTEAPEAKKASKPFRGVRPPAPGDRPPSPAPGDRPPSAVTSGDWWRRLGAAVNAHKRFLRSLLFGIEILIWILLYCWLFQVDPRDSWLGLLVWILPLYVLSRRSINQRRVPSKYGKSDWFARVGVLLGSHWKSIASILLLIFQVVAVRCVPVPKTATEDSRVALLWMFLGAFQIRIAVSLTRSHLKQVADNLESYLDADNWFAESTSNRERKEYEQRVEQLRTEGQPIEAEAQSQIELLLRLYHGILAAAYIVVAYFLVGDRFEFSDTAFIFENNEGFTAALTLLIVVIATVAIQVFQDVNRQIREESEKFEREVSLLSLSLVGVSARLDRIWKHASEYMPYVYRDFREYVSKWRSEHQEVRARVGSELRAHLSPPSPAGKSTGSDLDIRSGYNWFVFGWFDVSMIESLDGAVERRSTEKYRERILSTENDALSLLSKLAESDFAPPSDDLILQVMLLLADETPEQLGVEGVRSRAESASSSTSLTGLLERHCEALALKVARYLEDYDTSKVLESCDVLDLDATYLLDDVQLFSELHGSWTTKYGDFTKGVLKSDVRSGDFQDKLRLAEYARTVYFAGWIAQFAEGELRNHIQISRPSHTKAMPPIENLLPSWLSKGFREHYLRVFGPRLAPEDWPSVGPVTINPIDEYCHLLLNEPRSALHNLVRASLSRDRRRMITQVETRLDKWNPQRSLSIPVIPRLSDRARHLQALLAMSDRNQTSVRLRSVHDVLEPEASYKELDAAATRAYEQNKVRFPLKVARRLKDASDYWDRFCAELSFGGAMESAKLRPNLVDFPRARVGNYVTPVRMLTPRERKADRQLRLEYTNASVRSYREAGIENRQPIDKWSPEFMRTVKYHFRYYQIIHRVNETRGISWEHFRNHYHEEFALELLDWVYPRIRAFVQEMSARTTGASVAQTAETALLNFDHETSFRELCDRVTEYCLESNDPQLALLIYPGRGQKKANAAFADWKRRIGNASQTPIQSTNDDDLIVESASSGQVLAPAVGIVEEQP